jgi:arsenate reductase
MIVGTRHAVPLHEKTRMSNKIRVLFLCIGNSCRSQMAEGLLRHLGGEKFEVHSAGTIPSYVHPRAIQAMDELGIDISAHRSKHVSEFTGESFDFVISLCGENNCPSVIAKIGTSLHWPFPDPVSAAGRENDILAGFRKVRDAIKARIEEFIADPHSFASSPGFIAG